MTHDNVAFEADEPATGDSTTRWRWLALTGWIISYLLIIGIVALIVLRVLLFLFELYNGKTIP